MKHEKKHEEVKDTEHPKVNPERVEVARAELEELQKKVQEFNQLQDRLLRSAADFDNAKKRLAKDREEYVRYVLEDLILSLLPVLDNFKFALSHISGDDDKTRLMREGFLLIQKQLLQVLLERGLKPVESLGKPFNAHAHESVGHIVNPDQPEGVVLEEVQTGYELNGKLIRPAKVKISVHEEKDQDEKSEELT